MRWVRGGWASIRGPAALGPRVPLDVAASCLEALTPPNGPDTSDRKRHCSQSASVESQEPARRDTGIVIYPGPGPIGAVVAPAKAARSRPSCARRSFIAALVKIVASSAFIRCMTDLGTPDGARIPHHEMTS